MKLNQFILRAAVATFYLLFNTELSIAASAQSSRFRVTNQCEYTIWLQKLFKHKTSDNVVVKIETADSYDYKIPNVGLNSTCFQAKSGCSMVINLKLARVQPYQNQKNKVGKNRHILLTSIVSLRQLGVV